MPYTKVHNPWQNAPSTATPLNAAALDQIEAGVAAAQAGADSANTSIGDHIADTSAAHAASAVSFSPTGTVGAGNVQSAIAEVATDAASDLTAHTGDSSGAHAASAISVTPTGSISSSNVQAALAEIAAEVAGGILPDGDYGDVTVSGSGTIITIDAGAVTAAKVAADVATQAELDAHLNDATDAHDASAVSIADVGGHFTGTDVEAALQELGAGGAAWTSYAPAWTASSANPSIGNGEIVGRYRRDNDLMHIEIGVRFGTTTSAGTGQWFFGLPSGFVASGYDIDFAIFPVGTAWLFDSGSNTGFGQVVIDPAQTGRLVFYYGTSLNATTGGGSTSEAWNNGDQLTLHATVAVAAA